MTQYISLNVTLSSSQLDKLESAKENETKVILRLSSNMVGDDETSFPHKLLLTNRQVANLRKAFANHLSTDIKLSKTQLSKMIQSGGFLGRLLGPLLKTGLPLIKNVIKPLAKSILIPLGLTAAASAADTGIHKKILGSGATTLIISNDSSVFWSNLKQFFTCDFLNFKSCQKSIPTNPTYFYPSPSHSHDPFSY